MKAFKLLLMLFLITSCSILNHSNNAEIEQRNRKKRATIGIICIGAILIFTVHTVNETK